MPVKISINVPNVEAKVKGAWDETLPLLSEEILADCNEYCKKDKGALRDSSLIHSIPKEGKLVWQTPYARRQYWEIETASKDSNENATWKWCHVAKANKLKEWIEKAQQKFDEMLRKRRSK